MEKELFSKGKSVLAMGTGTTPVTISSATTTYGNWIDTEGFNSATFSIEMILGGAQTVSAIVFTEADLVGYGDSATMDATKYLLVYPTAIPVTAGTSTVRVGCLSKKRFIRIGFTTTTTDSSTIIAMCELNNAITQPSAVASSALAAASINAPSSEGDATVTPPKR